MDPLQIAFNSFVLVVLLIRFAERAYDHKSRHGIAALAFVAITGINTMFLSHHYGLAEAVARAAAIGAIYVVAGFVYVLLKRRPRSSGR